MRYTQLAEKKQLLDQYRPLPEDLVHNLNDWFRVELTYTSNALEGNTLNRRETALVVEKGLTVGGKTLVEHLEATNHAHALGWVKSQMKRKPQDIDEKDIMHIHDVILKGVDDANAGHYRSLPVRISGSTVILPNPRKVPDLMFDFALWLKKSKDLNPVELAFEAHYRLVTIHPFIDGNGRTARLLMNMILLMSGYPPAIISMRERLVYISSLEKAQLGGSKDDYLQLMTQSVERSLDIYIKALQGEVDCSLEEPKLLKIGELAKKTEVTHATIRYWTKEGLLEAERTESGYHLYASEMINRVYEIQKMKQKRYTLQEIKKFLKS